VREVGVEHGAAEAALVAQDEAAAVGKLEREPVPAGAVVGVDKDPAGHPEVQAQDRPLLGLEPQELAAALCVGERVADQSVGDLARRVWAADVRVAVVDGRDRPADGGLKRLAGALRLGQLGHGLSVVRRWLGTRKLAPGNYELLIRAVDPSGNQSTTSTVKFTIVKG
jgi:hypothetical protein